MNTLLVIEDDPTMLDLLATTLELENFTVHRAPDGHTGLALASQHRPHLILCDVMMPGIDGLTVLATLRADPQLAHTPFIFLTARVKKKDLRLGMVSGADDYLTKPVAIEDLLSAVRSRLSRHIPRPRPLPDFTNIQPLLDLSLSQKEAETLAWVAQGKTNSETAIILGVAESTVKKHLEHIFEKLSVEKRGAASLIAIEALTP